MLPFFLLHSAVVWLLTLLCQAFSHWLSLVLHAAPVAPERSPGMTHALFISQGTVP